MTMLIRLLGALIFTFFVSRLTLKASTQVMPGVAGIALGHVASLGLIWIAVALFKASYSLFAWHAGLIYVLPTVVWLVVDLARGPQPARV